MADKIDTSLLPKTIRELRRNLKMTQAEFAAAIGASQGSVSKWEDGREQPRYDAIAAITSLAGEFRDRPEIAKLMSSSTAENPSRIRIARQGKNLSQTEVAQSLGVSVQAVSQWETGKTTPTVQNYALLSQMLDIDFEWLRGNGEPAFPRDRRHNGHNGMSLLEWYAGQVAPAFVAAVCAKHFTLLEDETPEQRIANLSFDLAEAMVAEALKRRG